MTSHGAQGAQSAAWDSTPVSAIPTVGWFVRRSALWVGIMVAALVLACTLYAVASQVGPDGAHAVPKAPSPEIKI